jgi:hypothetical protein
MMERYGRWIGACMVVVVLLAGLVWLLWPAGDPPKPAAPTPAQMERPEPTPDGQLEVPDPPALNVIGVEVNAPDTVPPPDEQPAPPVKPEDRLHSIRVRLLDATDRPVPGVLFRYDLTPDIQAQQGQSGLLTRVQPEMLTRHAVTDMDGMFTVEFDEAAATSFLGHLILRMESESLALRGAPEVTGPPLILPGNGWSFKLSRGDAVHTLHCDPSTQVIVEMRYADGQPFTGTLGFSIWAIDIWNEETRPKSNLPRGQAAPQVVLEDATEHVIEGLHPQASLWGNIASTRPGFAATTSFRHNVAEGDRIVLVVARDERPRWGVIIDLSILDEDEEVVILFISPDGTQQLPMSQRGPGEVRSRNMAPRDGFRVVVAGENQSWFSEALTLSDRPFEWQRIVVPRQAPVAVEMNIIDLDGKPIQPAVVMLDTRMRANWGNPESYIPNPRQPESGMRQITRRRALADTEGRVRFQNLAAGSHELLVEAEGFFRRIISYTGSPGDTVYLGDIIMERIPEGGGGRVEVTLVGAPDPTLYVLRMTGRANVPFPPDGKLTISEIDFHRYHLVVGPAAGGDTVDHKQIVLEPSNPTVHWEAQYKSD